MLVLLANPASGRGRGARLLPAARRAFAAVGCADVRLTAARGDETHLARAALDDGCTTLAVLGGDGTLGNVARVLAGSGCRLAIVPAGTGNDFAKSAGLARDVDAIARKAAHGPDRLVDVGRVGDDVFLNAAGFGFDAVIADTQRPTLLRGDAVYVAAALRGLLGYPGFDAAVADATPLRRVRLLAAATRGTHTILSEVDTRRAAAFRVRFAGPPVYEADGELRQAASDEVEIACVPGALRLVGASRSTLA
jgi:diacylglycerol kinase family enzyme